MKKQIYSIALAVLLGTTGGVSAGLAIDNNNNMHILAHDAKQAKSGQTFEEIEGLDTVDKDGNKTESNLGQSRSMNSDTKTDLNSYPELTTGDYISLRLNNAANGLVENINTFHQGAGIELSDINEKLISEIRIYTEKQAEDGKPETDEYYEYNKDNVYQKALLSTDEDGNLDGGLTFIFRVDGLKANTKYIEKQLFDHFNIDRIAVCFSYNGQRYKTGTQDGSSGNESSSFYYTTTAKNNEFIGATSLTSKEEAEKNELFKAQIDITQGSKPVWWNMHKDKYWEYPDGKDVSKPGNEGSEYPTPDDINGALVINDESTIISMIQGGKIQIKSKQKNTFDSSEPKEVIFKSDSIAVDSVDLTTTKGVASAKVQIGLKPWKTYTDFEVSSDFGNSWEAITDSPDIVITPKPDDATNLSMDNFRNFKFENNALIFTADSLGNAKYFKFKYVNPALRADHDQVFDVTPVSDDYVGNLTQEEAVTYKINGFEGQYDLGNYLSNFKYSLDNGTSFTSLDLTQFKDKADDPDITDIPNGFDIKFDYDGSIILTSDKGDIKISPNGHVTAPNFPNWDGKDLSQVNQIVDVPEPVIPPVDSHHFPWWIIILIILLIIITAGVAGGVWFFLSKKNEDNELKGSSRRV